jgi:hypothetical protein
MARRKLPDRRLKIPVLCKKFPVPLRREFRGKAPKSLGFAGGLMREVAPKLKNSLFFSLLAGNLDAETGSTTTASATTHSGARDGFRSPPTAVNLAGFSRD